MGLCRRLLLPCSVLAVFCVVAGAQTAATAEAQPAQAVAASAASPLSANLSSASAVGTSSGGGSLDGSFDLKVPLLPTVVPRLQQILDGVIANASSRSGNRSFGQDTERAAAAGFVVRRGTQFFKDGKPFYFVGGNAYWFVDFYTLDWGREKIDEFLDTCQKLGISVLRTWFFNLGMPKEFDRYDARQIAGMEYVIWAAKRRGLMLTLTMGNLWNAYRGPEDFLLWATGSLEGKDILTFYSDPATRKLYRLHIWGLLSKVNPLTGLAPKDDPTIFSFNIINEPRCPGCFTPAQQAAHQDFLRDIGAFMRAITPLHLISAGTEGFFVEDRQTMLHWYNPGPGAQCDGEDWFAISALPYLDYATVHIYERHMELQPRPNAGNPNWPDWVFCDFPCYAPWFRMYTQLHTYLAANVLKKPVVIEEFGLTWFKQTPAQQRVIFKVATDLLVASAENSGALAGVMFWNAAHNDTVDWDGYNVQIDRPAYIQAGSALPSPSSLPRTMVTPEQALLMTPDNRTRPVPPDVVFNISSAPPALQAQVNVTQPPRRQPVAPATAAAAQAALPGALPAAARPAAAATPPGAAANASATTAAAARGPAAGATAPAQSATGAATPQQIAALAAALQPKTLGTPPVPQAPSSATATVEEAGTGAPRAQPVVTGPVATAVGRRLLGRAAGDKPQPRQQVPADDMAELHKGTTAGQQPLSALAAYPYQLVDQLRDIAEHLPNTQSYFGAFMRPQPQSSARHSRYHRHSHRHGHHSSSSSSRQLLVVQDELDPFRRGPLREQCAAAAGTTWRPYKLFNLTDDITTNPRYSALLQGGQVVAVISEATARLNQISDSRKTQPVAQQPVQAQAASAQAAAPADVSPAAGATAPSVAAPAAATPSENQPQVQQQG